MRAIAIGGALAAALAFSTPGLATGFTDIGQDMTPSEDLDLRLDGALRVRVEGLYNLDLDRGLTASGEPLFPVPVADPTSQWLRRNDMRLRTDLAIYAPGGMVAVKLRVDILDNVSLGGTPDSFPTASRTQLSPGGDAFRIKRAYGETLTPFGLISAGRMGNHWGLGMLANGGDCPDCDSGDAADRIAFLTPIAGLIWAVAYDFTATGPRTDRAGSNRAVDLEPSDDVQSLTFAVLRYHDDLAVARRKKADKATVDFGSYFAHQWQNNDIPASYLPTAQPVTLDTSQVMARGYRATAIDAWLRVVMPSFRMEAEAAYLSARIDQASLIPGVLYRDPITSDQFGAAVETELGSEALGVGVDAGYASGDAAYGFGAFPEASLRVPRRGDLDGPQANPPFDNTVNNFRFHPDYRVDRILFREIIGTVTDATYVRPHLRATLLKAGPGALTASIAAVVSWAVQPTSTPGGASALGVEIDPTLHYGSRDGFGVALEHGVLFPQAGLDNAELRLRAKPAQLWRLRLSYAF